MQAFIGTTLLTSKDAQPQDKPFEISDCRLSGFILRIQPSGVRTYYARFGRNRRVVLGTVGIIAPEEARDRCQKVLGNVAHGCHPLHGVGGTVGVTLGMFIADTYTTWVNASRPRTASNTLEKLHRLFRTWYPEPLTAITVECRVDKPRIDRGGKVRFLDQAEELRLRAALKTRDEELQSLRTSGNDRRQHRQKKLLPQLPHFGDHLTPAVLLSMNTSLRRGEVLKLRWTSVDFHRRLLCVEGRNAKNRQTRHVPLNEEAVNTLRRWREQSGPGAHVFGVATGFQKGWVKLLKRARISHFRWHDLRHHFASRLVQRGIFP